MVPLDRLIQEVRPLYQRKDPAHRFDHIVRIMEICRNIGEPTGADMDLLLRAAAIHGVTSREELRKILADDYDQVVTLAQNASWRPQTLEERILWDANILDSLGVIGLARTFTKGGHEKQTLEDTIGILRRNISRPVLTEEGKRIAVERIRDMETFLDKLEACLQTGV